MRLFSFAILFVGLTFAEGNSPTVAELEAMERYASQPTAHVTWSAHVDRIEGGQSSAVSAVVLADNTQLPSTNARRAYRFQHGGNPRHDLCPSGIRGARDRRAGSVVSLSPSFLSRYATSSSRCFGSGVFLNQMRAGAHFLSVSQCEMSDGWNGLSVLDRRRHVSLFRSRSNPVRASNPPCYGRLEKALNYPINFL